MVYVPNEICGAHRSGQTARDAMDPRELNTDDTFDVFYARELSGIIRLAFVLTGSRSAAEDLAQDAFFDAYLRWSQIGRYDKPPDVRAGGVPRAGCQLRVSSGAAIGTATVVVPAFSKLKVKS